MRLTIYFSQVMLNQSPFQIGKCELPTETATAECVANLTTIGESDADNATRVFMVGGGNFHFVAETGQWILWNGKRWVPDKDGGMIRLFTRAMEETARAAIGLPAGHGDRMVKHAMRSRDNAKVRAGLEMLKAIQGVTISAETLDANPWIIGTPGGMIDLKTGRAIQSTKTEFVTKSISCDLDPVATAPHWHAFLETITGGDRDLTQFLQRWTGYTLTGSVREECLAFLHGTGANGKGTFTEAVRGLLGDYAITAPESLFTEDRNNSATNDIARLSGCRMACAAELNEGTAFAESRLKAITSKDQITARFLHREFFDFAPTHKLWISGNHKPSVRGTDEGIWRRLRLIPFTVTIPEANRDKDLAEKLRAEFPGILRWAVQGCLDWQHGGLTTPRCVADATAEYRQAEDVIGQFLEEKTERNPDARVLLPSMFEAYRHWCETNGIRRPLTATGLNRKLEERGMTRIKSKGANFWEGIDLAEGR